MDAGLPKDYGRGHPTFPFSAAALQEKADYRLPAGMIGFSDAGTYDGIS
jgi:hypothetical protein